MIGAGMTMAPGVHSAMAPLACHLVTPGTQSIVAVIAKIDARSGVNFKATSRFACTATRRLGKLRYRGFIRKPKYCESQYLTLQTLSSVMVISSLDSSK